MYSWGIARNSGHCVRSGLDAVGAVYIEIRKSCLRCVAIPFKYDTMTVINEKSFRCHDFSFFLSFVKYIIFYTEIYWKKFFLGAQEENVLGIAGVDATQYHCFLA